MELKRERVREHLLAVIDGRRPGDAIPSERTLCATLGVSRPTLRAAVDELVATGLLVREHGRGMFVAPDKITQELVAEDHAASAPRSPGSWTSTVLELRTVRAGARIGRRLAVSPAAELVHVTRLRHVDGAPIALEQLHVPADLVPGLTVADMEGGFYAHLRERRGIRTAHAVQSIEPTVLSEEEAALLEVPVLSPALLFDRTTSDATGRPVEYVRSLYRGDRYRIVTRLALAGTAPDHPAADAARGGAWWGTVERPR
ncbi:GntR family transcriptional regulator [Streptomyces wedmorensis]